MSMFVHPLSIVRVEYDDTPENRDEAGQPVAGDPTSTDVLGLVQPKSAREQDDFRSAGSQVADHTIFLPAGTDIRGSDAIVQGSRRYSITGIRRFEFGGLAHIEVDATLVTPTPVTAGGS
jgi:hypothetical protein